MGQRKVSEVEFNGRKYKSLRQCFKENSDIATVSFPTFCARVKGGASIEDALKAPKQPTVTTRLGEHTVEGKSYRNLPEIAAAYGMTLSAVYKRYSRGYRGDDLVPKNKRKSYEPVVKERPPSKFSFEAGGRKFRSAAEACREFGTNYATFRKRLELGWTIEQCIGMEPAPDKRIGNRFRAIYGGKKNRKFFAVVDGKEYRSLKSLADAFQIPNFVLRDRINLYGYSPAEAVRLPGKGKLVLVDGKEYKSLTEAATAFGLTLPVLRGRLHNGLTLEQALGIKDYETSRTIEYNGSKYKSIADLAERVGVKLSTLTGRLGRGMSLEDAISAGDKIINSGRYNRTVLERSPELANSPADLYFVKVIGQESLYKVGITNQGVDQRLKGLQFDVIALVSGRLIDVYDLEQQVLDLADDNRVKDATAAYMDGYTELLNLSPDEAKALEALILESVQ